MSIHPVTVGGRRRYETRWREGTKQRARRFDLKRDAEAWDREVARRQQLGPIAVQQLTVKGPTLASWVADRWGPQHATGLEAKTRDLYASSWEVHIEPWLGHLQLQEITVGRLREWQAQRLAAGVTPNALKGARTVLSSVLRHAAESEAIQANPVSLVRPPRLPHKDQVIALSPRQVEQFRRLLGPRDAAIVSVLAYSGIRPGEMRALRWGDVGTNTIFIQRAANPDGTIKAPKTRHGTRNVRLLQPLADDLATWRAHRPGHGRDLVFPSTDGHAMTEAAWNDWRARVWRPARPLVVDHNPRPYDLRHSFASLLLAEGRSVHYVAEQLGHDARLTLSTYGHLIAEYADSGNIDVVSEINAGRAAAADWQPPAAQRRGDTLGARQRAVLLLTHHAGDAGRTFPVWNERRAALNLTERGLLAVLRGTGERRRFIVTTPGQKLANEQHADEVFGLRSADPSEQGEQHA